MAQAVIEDFEFVNINEQDGEFVTGASLGEGQGVLQAIEKESAIGQVGQGIVERTVGQHVLGAFPLGDVAINNN